MAVSESWSVWAMPPPGPLADALQDEIDALARRFPDAPNFPPHVTLIGGFEAGEAEARAVLRALAAKLQVRRYFNERHVAWPSQVQHVLAAPLLQPYRLTLDRVASGAIFHQCVFVLCAADDATMQVMAA